MATKRRREKQNNSFAAPHRSNSRVLTIVNQATLRAGSRPGPATPPGVTAPAVPRHGQQPLHRPGAYELPALYHETYLRVLPRDPHLVFTYWEIAGATLEKAGKTLPDDTEKTLPALLRLYDAGARASRKQREKAVGDIPVEKGVYSRYIRVPEPGRRYRLEYGITTETGRFVPLCASNPVDVPAARVQAAVIDKRFKAETEKLFACSARSGMTAAWTLQDAPDDVTGLLAAPVGRSDTGSSRFI
jgi:hypothetical protein